MKMGVRRELEEVMVAFSSYVRGPSKIFFLFEKECGPPFPSLQDIFESSYVDKLD